MAADVVGPDGEPVRGEVGELVIRRPQPGQTRGFWNDPDRYLETYWSRLARDLGPRRLGGVDADGYWYIRGRSDDTLKVAGKRVGPAEVEAAATAHPVGRRGGGDRDPARGQGRGDRRRLHAPPRRARTTTTCARSIAERVVADLGKTLRPEAVVVVPALPKTRSGKIMRRVVRAAYLGLDPGDLSALDDPTTIDAIRRCGPGRR